MFRRIHSFELHDQRWCPAVLRDALTEWLRVVWTFSHASTVVAPVLHGVLARSPARRIVDICSGGTGPIVPVQRQLESIGVTIPVVVTDKFPGFSGLPAWGEECVETLSAYCHPVDAKCVPVGLCGFRTLFNSFHHFQPGEARGILEDAYRSGQPIAIFEITERAPHKVLLSFGATFFSVFLLMPAMRPRRPLWWMLTYLLPVIPAMIAWDGFVSHLRSYTAPEITALIGELEDATFHWQIGRVSAPRWGVEVSYFTGVPVK